MKKNEGLSIVVAGRPVKVTHEVVRLSSVSLNADNPRIRFQLERRGKKRPTPRELCDIVREQPGYDGLQKAIRKAGGIHDPVIVSHDGLVIEGNSRVAVLMTLHDGNKADERWKEVPVQRLPKDVPESCLAMLMAAHHVAGKTVWRPYAQADQISQLHHKHNWTLEQIADETRMTKREVQQYLDAYRYLVGEVLPHVKDGNGSDVLESKWSHALEFVKRKNLALLREDPTVRKDLAKLMVQGKIKGVEVRQLDKVLKNRKASKALKKDGFIAAKAVLQESDPTIASKVLKDMQRITGSLNRMAQDDLVLLKSPGKARDIFIELIKSVRVVASFAGVSLGVRNG
jgi:hypothetical protein